MLEVLTVTAEDMNPEASALMRARSRWLHKLTMELKPEFEKRNRCYPEHLSIHANLPSPFVNVPGFLTGETMPYSRKRDRKQTPLHNMIFGGILIIGPNGVQSLMDEDEDLPDNINEIDVHVRVRANIPFETMAAGTLVHELCHAVLLPGHDGDHGAAWTALAASMGLEPMRTRSEDQAKRTPLADSNVGLGMIEMVRPMIERIGAYPHEANGLDFDINKQELLSIYPSEVRAKLLK